MTSRRFTRQYKVVSITKVCPSNQSVDSSWYKYIICCDGSIISGERQGTQLEVTEHVNDFISKLNNRDLFAISYVPRGRPKKPEKI